jgi:hypothetical protein
VPLNHAVREARIGETKCCHGLARRVSGGLARGAPPASRIMIGLHFSPSSQRSVRWISMACGGLDILWRSQPELNL